MSNVALDSSVIVPALTRVHEHHGLCADHIDRATVTLQSVMLETLSTLTRLPSGLAVELPIALALFRSNFALPIVSLSEKQFVAACDEFAGTGIAGGRMYDALIGWSARAHEATLVTRDRRALPTYAALGVNVQLLA